MPVTLKDSPEIVLQANRWIKQNIPRNRIYSPLSTIINSVSLKISKWADKYKIQKKWSSDTTQKNGANLLCLRQKKKRIMKKIIFLMLFAVIGEQQAQAQCTGTSIVFKWGAGAGTTYTYQYDGLRNGKCAYKQVTPGTTIEWTGSRWNIYGNGSYSGNSTWHSTVNVGDRPSNNIADWVADAGQIMISLSGTGTIDHPSLATVAFSKSLIQMYPNPTSSIINLKTQNNIQIDKIVVTDLTGKKVVEINNANQINVAKLSTGLYILEAFSGEEKFTSKFIKE
jgi:Secretion system C-terminal sorting domain